MIEQVTRCALETTITLVIFLTAYILPVANVVISTNSKYSVKRTDGFQYPVEPMT